MILTPFIKYLLIINGIGFMIYIINMLIYTYTSIGQIDALLMIGSLLGGSLGIAIAIVLFDRKSVKENMMSRVFVFCVLVIQIIVYLMMRGHMADNLNFKFWEFFGQNRFIMLYLVVINLVTFAVYAIDKIAAIKGRRRIRIVTLLGLAVAGGSIGAILGVYVLRHKTRKDYFTVGIPLIMVMQVVVLFYAMNVAW